MRETDLVHINAGTWIFPTFCFNIKYSTGSTVLPICTCQFQAKCGARFEGTYKDELSALLEVFFFLLAWLIARYFALERQQVVGRVMPDRNINNGSRERESCRISGEQWEARVPSKWYPQLTKACKKGAQMIATSITIAAAEGGAAGENYRQLIIYLLVKHLTGNGYETTGASLSRRLRGHYFPRT